MKKRINQSKKDVISSEKKGRFFRGTVVSDKADKTVVVLVDRYQKHSKYGKRYKISKKYKAHDEQNKFKKGNKVIIQECQPISKDKKWTIATKYE
jgi:small subunit ribosomal protein S17